MVGNRPMATPDRPQESLAEALDRVHPELAAVREVATEPVYLVGGAVRDLLLGRGRADIDLVVEGDAAALASRLGADVVSHERFATAKVALDDHEVDIATARSETYPHPGSLPVVEPATEHRSRPCPPRLHDQRDGDHAARRAAPDRSVRGERRPCCRVDPRPPSRLLPGRPDAGASGRPLRGPFRLRVGVADGSADARGRPEHRLGRPPRHRAAAPCRRRRGAAGVCAACRVGAGGAARGRSRADRPRLRLARVGAVEGRGAARPGAAAGGVGTARRRAELGSGTSSRAPVAGGGAGRRSRSGRARPRPGAGGRVARPLPGRVARHRAGDRR